MRPSAARLREIRNHADAWGMVAPGSVVAAIIDLLAEIDALQTYGDYQQFRDRAEAAEQRVSALTAERDQLREALQQLVTWNRNMHGAAPLAIADAALKAHGE